MKRASPFWFGAFLVSTTGLLYCGGSSSDSTPGGSAGAPGDTTTTSGGTTSGGTTSGGTTSGGTTSGGTTSGGTTTGNGGADMTGGPATTTGGAGMTGAGGAGGTGGRGGGGRGGMAGTGVVTDAGNTMCPAMRPNNGGNCTSGGEMCPYTGVECTCAPAGMTRDGGMRDQWMCVAVRPDAGGGRDGAAATCPNNPNNGGRCTSVGEVCPYNNGLITCTCEMGAAMNDRWACAIGIRDGGRRGDGG